MQCYSGTYLYELLRRQAGRARFRQGHEVVIFEDGHVLPGYFEFSPDGKTKVLVGVETTVAGGGGTELATITASEKSIGNRRVVDAELFALVELLQDDLTNGKQIVDAVLAQTAKEYGFDLSPIEETLSPGGGMAAAEMLNASLFGFGHANVPDGDIARSDSSDDGRTNFIQPPSLVRFTAVHMESPAMRPDAQMILLPDHELIVLSGRMASDWRNLAHGSTSDPDESCGKRCAFLSNFITPSLTADQTKISEDVEIEQCDSQQVAGFDQESAVICGEFALFKDSASPTTRIHGTSDGPFEYSLERYHMQSVVGPQSDREVELTVVDNKNVSMDQ
jgi:hypothetical protein